MKSFNCVAWFLVVVGAINWGLVGALNFDLVAWLDGLVNAGGTLAKVLYIVVGVAGLLFLFTYHMKKSK